jgi:hypothetical protein
MNTLNITLVMHAWYKLPDGTRVQAVQPFRHWRLQTAPHKPLFEIVDGQIYQLRYDTATNAYTHNDCDLQLADIIPD